MTQQRRVHITSEKAQHRKLVRKVHESKRARRSKRLELGIPMEGVPCLPKGGFKT